MCFYFSDNIIFEVDSQYRKALLPHDIFDLPLWNVMGFNTTYWKTDSKIAPFNQEVSKAY